MVRALRTWGDYLWCYYRADLDRGVARHYVK